MQMCFVGFSVQIEFSCLAVSVALVTHCQAVQVSAMTNFVILNQRTQARAENCTFFGLNEAKYLFLHSSHACTHDFLALGWALTMLKVAQAHLKCCCFLHMAVVVRKPAIRKRLFFFL